MEKEEGQRKPGMQLCSLDFGPVSADAELKSSCVLANKNNTLMKVVFSACL